VSVPLPSAFYTVVDDYFSFDECRQAIDEYREAHGISAEMVRIDNMGVYWRVPGA
jgi:O-methyltransferase